MFSANEEEGIPQSSAGQTPERLSPAGCTQSELLAANSEVDERSEDEILCYDAADLPCQADRP